MSMIVKRASEIEPGECFAGQRIVTVYSLPGIRLLGIEPRIKIKCATRNAWRVVELTPYLFRANEKVAVTLEEDE